MIKSPRLILAAALLCASTLCAEHHAIAKKQPNKPYNTKKVKQRRASHRESGSKRLSPKENDQKHLKNSSTEITPQSCSDTDNSHPRYFAFGIGRSMPIKKFQCYQCNSSSAFSGTEDYKEKFNAARMYSAALGAKIGEKFKVDLSFAYRGKYKYSYFVPKYNGSQKQKLYSFAVLLNGYIIPYKFNRIEPYITAGAGITFNNAGTFYSGKPELTIGGRPHMDRLVGKMRRSFAWTMGLGSTFILSNHIKLDCAYKYTHLGKFLTTDAAPNPITGYDTEKAVGGVLKLHEIGLGIIYEY